ncbi:unnamed protein product [Gadus morhua 'NCC']
MATRHGNQSTSFLLWPRKRPGRCWKEHLWSGEARTNSGPPSPAGPGAGGQADMEGVQEPGEPCNVTGAPFASGRSCVPVTWVEVCLGQHTEAPVPTRATTGHVEAAQSIAARSSGYDCQD